MIFVLLAEISLSTVPAVARREVITPDLYSPDMLGSGVTRLTVAAATSLVKGHLSLSKKPLLWRIMIIYRIKPLRTMS